MAKQSAKPKISKITRNGTSFTVDWTPGETYEKQELDMVIAPYFQTDGTPAYNMKMVPVKGANGVTKIVAQGLDWTPYSVGKATKSKTIPVGQVAAVSFRVRGKAKGKSISEYHDKTYKISAPSTPSVSKNHVNALTTAFSWSTPNAGNDSSHVFAYNAWQTAIIQNCEIADGNQITTGWSPIYTTGANDGWTAQEAGLDVNSNSYTRWVRVRAIGWAGLLTGWVYNKRVYARPNPAINVSASRSPFGNNGYTVNVSWYNPSSLSRPVDSAEIMYGKVPPIVTVHSSQDPTENVTMSLSCPTTGVDWRKGADPGNLGGGRSYPFMDSDGIPLDNCFFVKVTNTYDGIPIDSDKVLASGGYGKLVNPSTPSETQESEGIYTVSVNSRGTTISEAAIAVYFRTKSKQSDFVLVSIIPPGESTSDPFRIPEVSVGDTFSFGVRAFVGNYNPASVRIDSILMSSDIVWGAGVPLPPIVTASQKDTSTIHVTWNQSWEDATEAELSWADHEDAWTSTSEPTTYVVNKSKAGEWNIANLAVGTWWVKVRLIKSSSESTSYSAYGAPAEPVKLSAAPDIPSLVLSNTVIAKDGETTCYWAYVSGDGTAQQKAMLYEAFPVYEEVETPTGNPYANWYYEQEVIGGAIRYVRSSDQTCVSGKTYYVMSGDVTYSDSPIASTDSAQHITIHASDFGWEYGEVHYLALSVMSLSGESSKSLSTPVSLTIAEKLSIEVISSSLQYVNVPSEYDLLDNVTAYRRAYSLTEFPLTFALSDFASGSKVTCIIDRAESFSATLPDDTDYEGFEGDTVLIKDFDTKSISIDRDDFTIKLDDNAAYRVRFILKDTYGQSAETKVIPTGAYIDVDEPAGNPKENNYYEYVNDEYILTDDIEVDPEKTYYTKEEVSSFEVHWTHQAVKTEAIIEADKENNVTFITPLRPESGYAEGDMIDIYRLSADTPVLIYTGALMDGTKYVDPYPAFGEFGGYRIVYRTYNGDYIVDRELAFTNYLASEHPEYRHDLFGIVIDFDGKQVILPGNVSFSNKWAKDFTLTKYLGGSVQGDWNPAIERTMSAKTTIPIQVDEDNIELIRQLATYPGICHIRTPDGSSFAANIEVSDDREEKWTTRISKISLTVTRCVAEVQEGMTYAEWIENR